MIITTKAGKTYDTEADLTAPERHVLQKLFLWKTMAPSIEVFREKKEQALVKGWNNSGPIQETASFKDIIRDLEQKLVLRLDRETS